MIPLNVLRKMGVYKLNLNGVDVQAKVVDNKELVNDGITDLMGKFDPRLPIVGFDLKISSQYPNIPKLLVLFVKDRCLLVQLGRMREFPTSLMSFLSDPSICFLRLQDSWDFYLSSLFATVVKDRSRLKPGVDIGTFAARALKDRQLDGCINLVELTTKAGLPEQEQASQCREPDWGALCFTQEEVKYTFKNAYECYRIGIKLLSAF